MATSETTQSNDIDIISLWHGLRRSLRSLLMIMLFIGVATFGLLSIVTPHYTSEAQLAISAKVTNPFPDAKDGQQRPEGLTQRLDREAINTHVNALRAPDLLIKVANALELGKQSEFGGSANSSMLTTLWSMIGLGGSNAGAATDEQIIKAINERLQVSAARESRFIAIRFSSSSPELAAAFTNSLAENYRQSLVDVPVNETQQVVNALLPKIEQLKKELLISEAEVQRFRAETDQFRAGAQSTPVNARRMAALNDELIKVETQRSAAESKWKTAQELSASGNVEVLQEVQNSPVIQRLVEQRVRVERQVAEARATLLSAHPRMKQLNSDLARIRSSVRGEVRNVVRGLEKQFRTSDFRLQDIRREIESLKVKVVDTSENKARLRSLDSSARSKRAELERLQRQLEDNKTLVVTKTVPVEAQIVSAGRPTTEPTFPKKVPFTLLAMVAALIFGLALVTAKEIIMGGRRRSVNALANEDAYRPQPVTGQPDNSAQVAAKAAADAMRQGRKSPSRKADLDRSVPGIVDVAARLIDNGRNVAGYRSMVVGDSQRIDASREAMAIAQEISRDGKQVALVDWNIAEETVGSELGVVVRSGMIDLLEGTATFDEIIGNVPQSRVHYMFAGSGLAFEDQELDADGLNAVLDALDEAYDHVVVFGRYGATQALFEAVQGRFDAGIVVSSSSSGHGSAGGRVDTFLGFEVTDIDIIHCIRTGKSLKIVNANTRGQSALEPAE